MRVHKFPSLEPPARVATGDRASSHDATQGRHAMIRTLPKAVTHRQCSLCIKFCHNLKHAPGRKSAEEGRARICWFFA